uniref:5-formyltetrahydrofolate cyclo-ligase n=1 Tax=Astyanax mexicanus TaxID=7994 RepID=A0A8B9KI00_ASTMX
MAALRAAKQALRKEIKKRVATLSEEEKLRQSLLVSQKLFEHPRYKSSQRVAVFLSMSDEVRTEAIVQHMFSSGKVCFIPKYLSNSSHMDMLRLNSLEDISSLPLTSWNIRQPGENDTEREEALDTGGSFMNKSPAPQSNPNPFTLSMTCKPPCQASSGLSVHLSLKITSPADPVMIIHP